MMVDYVHLLLLLVFVPLSNKCALNTHPGPGADCLSLAAFLTPLRLNKERSAEPGLRILWTLDALPHV